ncbi:hypothetical protein LVJ94_40270 [Pendulispora rubella]|uniref:Lipoprotein n=1 Tax=Pendulispora rubella TaxID=2741070 RepID=A0ABZ2L1K4_9BACT
MISFQRALALLVFVTGCAGPGLYGHSPRYVPLAEEESAAAGVREYDPVMYAREPEEWKKRKSSLFGVVTSRTPGAGGAAYLAVTVRKLEPRNLCDSINSNDTCRVTVSDRDFGAVHALVRLKPEDDVGEISLGPGSLVRVIGTFGQDTDAGDGGPILRADYYRHWPRGYFVTRADANEMRQ